ncbi:uncharacterized protein PRCAT00005098001 [Priceomyces carsonii]|uniref:uncharacterized protein n=1 Tax=Priceomyces carsonii TaxID=28549 RepID=UPI002ED9F49E|nr:unnamed protein product [Priceomyces carsonii]
MPNFVKHNSHNLTPPKRYITGFDAKGCSIINTTVEPEPKWTDVADKSTKEHSGQFSLLYTTKGFPVNIDQANDIEFYKKSLNEGISVTMPGGTVLRVVDMAPGSISPMHRTSSVDYGIVLQGQVEAIMDSGESVLLNKDDVLVQRGTMHAWKNTSLTDYARMIYVLVSAKPLVVNGQSLKEDLGHIEGVPKNE